MSRSVLRLAVAHTISPQPSWQSVRVLQCVCASVHTHDTYQKAGAVLAAGAFSYLPVESVARVVCSLDLGACSLAHTRGFVAAVINIQRLRCLLFRGPLSLAVNKDCRAYVRSEAACTLNMYEQGSSERKNDGKAAYVYA